MPSDRRSSPNRSVLGHWVPLAMTVTVATIGIVAWVWKERNDNEEDDYHGGRDDYPPPAPDYASQPPAGHTGYAPGAEPNAPPPPPGSRDQDDPSMFARMQGVVRRTPSPQQIFDGAGKRFAAGIAAAGAAVGGALSSIREEDSRHYEDHSRWSEEADSRRREQSADGMMGVGSMSAPAVPTLQRQGGYRKTVAIVVSSDAGSVEVDSTGFHTEHASILSHLPEHIDDNTRIFVLIFAPSLKQHPLATPKPAPSVASSYSHIGQEDLQTPSEEVEKPLTALDPAPANSVGTGLQPEGSTESFRALYQQAQALASRDTMIMPFTTTSGWVPIVRQIHPDIVYVQGVLGGRGGEGAKEVSRWVGQVVLVVGDDSGHGGLVDSEDEHGPNAGMRDNWWQTDSAVGLGRGIEVVEGMRMGEDWRRRVKGHD